MSKEAKTNTRHTHSTPKGWKVPSEQVGDWRPRRDQGHGRIERPYTSNIQKWGQVQIQVKFNAVPLETGFTLTSVQKSQLDVIVIVWF